MAQVNEASNKYNINQTAWAKPANQMALPHINSLPPHCS
jgi:hypothetical protein